MITDPYAVFAVPRVPKPKYLVPFYDPVFGSKIIRIGGNPSATFTTRNNGAGVWGQDARHSYSVFQPFNHNRVYMTIENRGGGSNGGAGGSWLHLNSKFKPVLGSPSNYPNAGADERWHPTQLFATQVIVAGESGTTFWWFDLVNNVVTRSWTLPFTPKYFGGAKGQISKNGRFIVMVDTAGSQMAVVDMNPQSPYAPYPDKRIGPVCAIPATIGGVAVTGASATLDPSGRYVVLRYAFRNGVEGEFQRVYDVDPVTLTLTLRVYSGNVQCIAAGQNWLYSLGHTDQALNPFDNNEPVIIGQEACGNVGATVAGVQTVNGNGIGHVVMVRLLDGAVTSLTDPDNEAYAHHISCRNYNQPGWVYVTYGAWPGQETRRYYDELVMVSMDKLQRVQRLAHLHSDFNETTAPGAICAASNSDFNYRSQPHGVPARDGRRIAFASNWLINGAGTGNCSVQGYVIDLR